jgi:hypothetical protein
MAETDTTKLDAQALSDLRQRIGEIADEVLRVQLRCERAARTRDPRTADLARASEILYIAKRDLTWIGELIGYASRLLEEGAAHGE